MGQPSHSLANNVILDISRGLILLLMKNKCRISIGLLNSRSESGKYYGRLHASLEEGRKPVSNSALFALCLIASIQLIVVHEAFRVNAVFNRIGVCKRVCIVETVKILGIQQHFCVVQQLDCVNDH